jgi:bifunctional N-acetylglucosamine-1-phosphate-uridyltransferase/glucosamine-1-phosphate-acetyltransferase GlmU-like protein
LGAGAVRAGRAHDGFSRLTSGVSASVFVGSGTMLSGPVQMVGRIVGTARG